MKKLNIILLMVMMLFTTITLMACNNTPKYLEGKWKVLSEEDVYLNYSPEEANAYPTASAYVNMMSIKLDNKNVMSYSFVKTNTTYESGIINYKIKDDIIETYSGIYTLKISENDILIYEEFDKFINEPRVRIKLSKIS